MSIEFSSATNKPEIGMVVTRQTAARGMFTSPHSITITGVQSDNGFQGDCSCGDCTRKWYAMSDYWNEGFYRIVSRPNTDADEAIKRWPWMAPFREMKVGDLFDDGCEDPLPVFSVDWKTGQLEFGPGSLWLMRLSVGWARSKFIPQSGESPKATPKADAPKTKACVRCSINNVPYDAPRLLCSICEGSRDLISARTDRQIEVNAELEAWRHQTFGYDYEHHNPAAMVGETRWQIGKQVLDQSTSGREAAIRK